MFYPNDENLSSSCLKYFLHAEETCLQCMVAVKRELRAPEEPMVLVLRKEINSQITAMMESMITRTSGNHKG